MCECHAKLVHTAEDAADDAINQPEAQILLDSQQIHQNRFDGKGPFAAGRLFPNYLFQRTCAPDPFQGRTANEARNAVRAQDSDEIKISKVLRNYGYRRDNDDKEKLLVAQRILPEMRIDQSLRSYLDMVTDSEFMRPFYAMMLLTVDISYHRIQEALLIIEQTWTTSWGGGRVVNFLLFQGETVVCESAPSHESSEAGSLLPYNQGHGNTLFALFLIESEWGKKLMSIPGTACLANSSEYTTLMRGFFRFCELRKGQMSSRCRWRDDWSLKADRQCVLDLCKVQEPLF